MRTIGQSIITVSAVIFIIGCIILRVADVVDFQPLDAVLEMIARF